MSWKSYSDLDVFQRSYGLALRIHKLSSNFPPEELYSLTSQIRRSSKAICANIAEGHGKSAASQKEFVRYLNISIGSAEETRLWLRFCRDLEFLAADVCQDFDQEYVEIIKMIRGLVKYLQKP